MPIYALIKEEESKKKGSKKSKAIIEDKPIQNDSESENEETINVI